MEFSLTSPKGLGVPVANLLRQTVYLTGQSWRPIGFRLSALNTILGGKEIVEDTLSISSVLSSLVFSEVPDKTYDSPLQVVIIRAEKGEIDVNYLKERCKDFIVDGDNAPIVTPLNTEIPVELELFMYRASGINSCEDNRVLLRSYGYDANKITMSSRHSNIDVGFSVTSNENEDVITLHVKTPQEGVHLENMMKDFCSEIQNIYTSLQVKS